MQFLETQALFTSYDFCVYHLAQSIVSHIWVDVQSKKDTAGESSVSYGADMSFKMFALEFNGVKYGGNMRLISALLIEGVSIRYYGLV